MSQTNAKTPTWMDAANSLYPFLEPKMIELMKKQMPELEEESWRLVLGVLDRVHLELMKHRTPPEQIDKSPLPPSNALQELQNRVSVLEEEQKTLRADIEKMGNNQQQL